MNTELEMHRLGKDWPFKKVDLQSKYHQSTTILDQAGMFTVHKMCENRIIPEHGIIEVGTASVGVNINQE